MSGVIGGLLALVIITGLIYLIIKSAQKKKPKTNQTQPDPDPHHGEEHHDDNGGDHGHDDAHHDTTTTKADDAGLMFTGIAVVVIILFAIVGVFNWCSDDKPSRESSLIKSERFELKLGDSIRVNIRNGYNLETDGFGEKYYYQSKSVKKVLIGGGEPAVVNDGKDTYVYLSAYKKEITVLCTFKPKK